MLNWLFGNQPTQAEATQEEEETQDGSSVEEETKMEEDATSVPVSPASPPAQTDLDFNFDILYGGNSHSDLSDWTAHTLQSLLSQALPSCDIRPPHVIIMGAQSSGKTLLIISMVFYYLKKVQGLTEDMGNKLLRIFKTGSGMVTKRPIEIHLIHLNQGNVDSTVNDGTCRIKLRMHDQEGVYGTAEFDAIYAIYMETTDGPDVFMSPLAIYISSSELPNCSFIDLPGITAVDKVFSDGNGVHSSSTNATSNTTSNPSSHTTAGTVAEAGKVYTVKSLAARLAAQNNNILVLVETAANAKDLDNCSLLPLLKSISTSSRADLFAHSMLVLSQCDVIHPHLHKDLCALLQRKGEQFKKYPFRHVVGVINKFPDDSEPHTLSYPVFLQQFQETKRKEKQVFREVMTKGGHVSGDETILCTTPSLFYTIDMILLRWLETCLSGALEKLKRACVDKLAQTYATCSIPPRYYRSSTLKGVSLSDLLGEFVGMARVKVEMHLSQLYEQKFTAWANKIRANPPPSPLEVLGRVGLAAPPAGTTRATGDAAYRQWVEGVKSDWTELVHSLRKDKGLVDALDLFVYPSAHNLSRFPLLTMQLSLTLAQGLPARLRQVDADGLDLLEAEVYSRLSCLWPRSDRANTSRRLPANPTEEVLALLCHSLVREAGQHLGIVLGKLLTHVRLTDIVDLLEEDASETHKRLEAYAQLSAVLVQHVTLRDCLDASLIEGAGDEFVPRGEAHPAQRMQHIRNALLRGCRRLRDQDEQNCPLPHAVEDSLWQAYVQGFQAEPAPAGALVKERRWAEGVLESVLGAYIGLGQHQQPMGSSQTIVFSATSHSQPNPLLLQSPAAAPKEQQAEQAREMSRDQDSPIISPEMRGQEPDGPVAQERMQLQASDSDGDSDTNSGGDDANRSSSVEDGSASQKDDQDQRQEDEDDDDRGFMTCPDYPARLAPPAPPVPKQQTPASAPRRGPGSLSSSSESDDDEDEQRRKRKFASQKSPLPPAKMNKTSPNSSPTTLGGGSQEHHAREVKVEDRGAEPQAAATGKVSVKAEGWMERKVAWEQRQDTGGYSEKKQSSDSQDFRANASDKQTSSSTSNSSSSKPATSWSLYANNISKVFGTPNPIPNPTPTKRFSVLPAPRPTPPAPSTLSQENKPKTHSSSGTYITPRKDIGSSGKDEEEKDVVDLTQD